MYILPYNVVYKFCVVLSVKYFSACSLVQIIGNYDRSVGGGHNLASKLAQVGDGLQRYMPCSESWLIQLRCLVAHRVFRGGGGPLKYVCPP